MNFWVGLLVGLILGWVVKWVVDWAFWQRNDDVKPAAERVNHLDLQGKVSVLEAEKASLRARLQEMQNKAPEVVVKEIVKEVMIERDRLQKIHGIGDVFTTRFNNAGIYSFAQLAALSPSRIRDIIDPEEWQTINPDLWIVEAKQFAAQSQKVES